jgi:MFS family permease
MVGEKILQEGVRPMTAFPDLAPAASASAFGFGFVMAVLGSIKENLSETLRVPHDRIARWLSTIYILLIPLIFIAGIVADRWGARGTLIGCGLLSGLGFFGLALCRERWTTWLSLSVIALGAAALNVGAILLLPHAYFGHNAASANLGLVFWSLGGLTAGSLAPVIFSRLEFRRALSLIAVICLVPAFFVMLTPAETFPPTSSGPDLGVIWSSLLFWSLALAFLLYCPVEGFLGEWSSTYLTQLGFSERRAGLFLSIFWFTFVASRLVAACFQYYYVHDAEPWVVIVLSCLAAIGVGGLAGTRERLHAVLWLVLVALSLGPILPNLIGIIYRGFGDGEIGAAYGSMMLIGGAGSLVMPPIMNAYVRRTSLRKGFRLPTMISILLAGGSLVLALSR